MSTKIKFQFLSVVILLAMFLGISGNTVATGATTPGLENFVKKNDYSNAEFADVPKDAWYNASVQRVYELGLMAGTGYYTFNPLGNITIAEAITIACQLHNIYYGKTIELPAATPWYQGYVDYATTVAIVSKRDYDDYTATATRAQVATILVSALPNAALEKINNITAIPDVSRSHAHANAIYALYNAAIVRGVDQYGAFNPDNSITRAEVASIISHIALPELRKSFTLPELPLSVDKTDLSISSKTVVTVTAAGGMTLSALTANQLIASVEWGIPDGNTVPLSIIPKGKGSTTIKVYDKSNPAISQTINVTITGFDPADIIFSEDEYYQLARDACEYIKRSSAYPHSLDIISAEAGSLASDPAVHFSYFILDAKGNRTWEIKHYTYTPSGKIAAFTPWLIDDEFVSKMSLNVEKIMQD